MTKLKIKKKIPFLVRFKNKVQEAENVQSLYLMIKLRIK